MTMKRTFLLVALVMLVGVSAQAQQAAPAPAKPSEADLAVIKAAALDYAEGCYEAKPERMERALHPELAKRIVRNDANTGRSVLDNMGATTLVNIVARGCAKNTPPERQQKDVTVLDVYGGAASVKLVMDGWIDYLHVAKFNGRWVIVNVLWEMKPQPPRQ
jgi:hypothetical protein